MEFQQPANRFHVLLDRSERRLKIGRVGFGQVSSWVFRFVLSCTRPPQYRPGAREEVRAHVSSRSRGVTPLGRKTSSSHVNKEP